MEDIFAWVQENRWIVIGVLAALFFGGDSMKGVVSKILEMIKNKFVNNVKPVGSPNEVEYSDFEALQYLRKRAKEIGDDQLVDSIKTIAGKFFDSYE
jgi:hypothetical protein